MNDKDRKKYRQERRQGDIGEDERIERVIIYD